MANNMNKEFQQAIENCLEDAGHEHPEKRSYEQAEGMQRLALNCIDGHGDSYETMRNAVVLGEAFKATFSKVYMLGDGQ